MGSTLKTATSGEAMKKAAPTTTTVVSTCRMSLAPPSRKRSSWLTSSLSTLISSPRGRLENHAMSRSWMWRQVSRRSSSWMAWARFRHSTP